MIPADRSRSGATQTASAIEDTGEGGSARERLAELIVKAGRVGELLHPAVAACKHCTDARTAADAILAAGWRPPLPDSETEWGYRYEHWTPGSGREASETEARSHLVDPRVTLLKRRAAGPWVVVSE